MICSMARRPATGGRPSKGDREPLTTRAPTPLAQAVRDDADRLGLTYSDHIANILAAKYGFPPVSTPKDEAQMQLSA